MSFTFDQLSGLFVLLITGVGTLIHIYSIGYMAHDERRRRFFAFLNLFIAAMLTLVLAADYLVMFLGWEGVGLASYLLIGFWQHKDSAAAAAKKAFVVNRVGDLGMALAIMLMFAQFGTTAIEAVNESIPGATQTVATAMGLLLLLGACGKSAQVPLQSWLLDAMEGPTPVSALIHAATMVTAGVYLVVRSAAIFDASEAARTAVIVVGLVTLLVGAWIGCTKDDIKKALAGSTMSQIGYMMLAAGLGPAGYAFAIFHLITHGFFKANMFLGAGSVMHGMNDDVDMRHYGALRKAMPFTFATFALGYLAIIGFPGFSGFFSKDKIIEAAFGENFWVGIGALLGAGVTAFYMTRLMMMTFFGDQRWKEDVHPHESPKVMTYPLIALAALSLLGGLLLHRRLDRRLARTGRRPRPSTTSCRIPAIGDDAHRHRCRRRGRCRSATSSTARRPIAGETPSDSLGVGLDPGRSPRALRQRDQRRRRRTPDAPPHPLPRVVRPHGRRRARHRHRRPTRRHLAVPASAADRLRPLVRADDVRRRCPRTPCSPGGDPRMILTVLIAIPIAGATAAGSPARATGAPTDRRSSSRSASRSSPSWCRSSCSRSYDLDAGGHQLTEKHEWIKAFGAWYSARRQRHRHHADPADHDPDADRDPRRLGRSSAPTAEHQRLLRLDARRRGTCSRRVLGHRRVPVLRVLRGDADPVLLPDRLVRRPQPLVRRGEVPDLQPRRRPAHAGVDRRPVRRQLA